MSKKKIVIVREAKDRKRLHPLDADQLENVTGGATLPDPLPSPTPKNPLPGPAVPASRDWGWWE